MLCDPAMPLACFRQTLKTFLNVADFVTARAFVTFSKGASEMSVVIISNNNNNK